MISPARSRRRSDDTGFYSSISGFLILSSMEPVSVTIMNYYLVSELSFSSASVDMMSVKLWWLLQFGFLCYLLRGYTDPIQFLLMSEMRSYGYLHILLHWVANWRNMLSSALGAIDSFLPTSTEFLGTYFPLLLMSQRSDSILAMVALLKVDFLSDYYDKQEK